MLSERAVKLKATHQPSICQGYSASGSHYYIDQQNRALEAATISLRYFTALCPPVGKTREIFDLHFLAKPGFRVCEALTFLLDNIYIRFGSKLYR